MLHILCYIPVAKELQNSSKKQWGITGFAQLCCSFKAYHYTKSCEISRNFFIPEVDTVLVLCSRISVSLETCSQIRIFFQLYVIFLLHVCSLSISQDRSCNNTALCSQTRVQGRTPHNVLLLAQRPIQCVRPTHCKMSTKMANQN